MDCQKNAANNIKMNNQKAVKKKKYLLLSL